MSGSIHQTAISEIRESYSLSDRQIGSSVCHRLLHLEIIKISHTAIQFLLVESIKCHTYTLKGLQLIRRKHLLTDILPVLTIQRVGILQLALIVITPKSQPYDLTFSQRLPNFLVGILIITSQVQPLIRLDNAQ